MRSIWRAIFAGIFIAFMTIQALPGANAAPGPCNVPALPLQNGPDAPKPSGAPDCTPPKSTRSIRAVVPSNDDFGAAIPVTSAGALITDTTLATSAADDPTTCGSGINSKSVWYRLTVPVQTGIGIETYGSSYDTVVTVWTGTRGALTSIACDDDNAGNRASALSFTANPGVTYYVEVMAYGSGSGGQLNFYVHPKWRVGISPSNCASSVSCLPTPASYAFSQLALNTVSAASLASLDIFVLYQNCDIGTALNIMQKGDLNNWVAAGGKLIIYDSDSCGTVSGGSVPDYSWLALPFRTNNPGQTGTTGTLLNIIENNSLSSTDVNSPYYLDSQNITNNTDAAGDGNVMITQDSRWCGDMMAQNVNQVSGWVHTYGAYGNGLMIYDGMDADSMGGNVYLTKVWYLELLQAWRPSGLPCGAPVAALKLPFTSVSGSWRVCGGYYHYDHQTTTGTQFGLDFCHNNSTTANQVVLAPAEGKVAGVFNCNAGGGWGLKLELTRGGQTIVNQDGTKYYFELCHLSYPTNNALVGTQVQQGARLGTVNDDDVDGNTHIHTALYTSTVWAGGSNTGVAFQGNLSWESGQYSYAPPATPVDTYTGPAPNQPQGCVTAGLPALICDLHSSQIDPSPNANWAYVPGAAFDVAAGVGGSAFALGTGTLSGGHLIYQYVGGASTWQNIAGAAEVLAVASNGDLLALQNSAAGNAIYRRNGGSWANIAGAAIDVAAGTNGPIYVLGTTPTSGGFLIYQYVGGSAVWQNIPGGAAQLAVAADGSLWARQNNNDIYRWNGSSWALIQGKAVKLAAGGGSVYALGTTSGASGYTIYKYVGGSSTWQNIAGEAVDLAVDGNGVLWALQNASASNAIYRCTTC